MTFHEDQDNEVGLLKILRGLSEKVGSRLRKAGWLEAWYKSRSAMLIFQLTPAKPA
jgi:hypothetical protein